jgi:hypothetical protein
MIKVSITTPDKNVINKEINISRTLSGDYLLKEHPEIDIIVMPSKFKILTLPKNKYTEYTSKIQNNLMNFLKDNGVVMHESIRGSNIFGSVEATFPEKSTKEGQDTLQVAVYMISEFLDQERPQHMYAKEYEKAFYDALSNPNSAESTELGEVPHEDFKGSIPKHGFPNKAIYRYTY